MVLKFLKQLPNNILAIYTKELKSLEKQDATIQNLLLQDITSSFVTHTSDQSTEPEFLKKYCQAPIGLK